MSLTVMTRRHIPGPAGQIELLVDSPGDAVHGVAVIAHPQPLLGGSAEHKIPHVLARGACEVGWLAVRPNFRGVGTTAGQHDDGVGEADDMLAVVDAVAGALPLALIGFSFGAFVQAKVARHLANVGRPATHVILLGMPVGAIAGRRTYDPGKVPHGSVVIHGQLDEQVPLSAVLQWAAIDPQPVVVIPAADHFFKGRLPLLRSLVQSELQRGTRS